jgi:DNA-binding HxlR family transcriptional regulator
MARRTYNQYCGIACALDLVGERWTLLIVRNLLLGPLRYSDLLRGLPGITTNLLAKRLQEMEAAELIERTPPDGASYRLTPRGAALEPTLQALSAWGLPELGAPRRQQYQSADFLLLMLRRRYRGGSSLRGEIVADGVPYRVTLAPDRATIVRGAEEDPDIRISGDVKTVAKVFLEPDWSTRAPRGVEVQGSSQSYKTLVGAFERHDHNKTSRAGAA